MCEPDPRFSFLTRYLIKELFVVPADEDYLIARMSFKIGRYNQFSWSAQQATEKYIKGALLFNGVDISSDGHDLNKLYQKLFAIADDILPLMLCPPAYFPITSEGNWGTFEPMESFITRLDANGDPSQRYRQNGFFMKYNDLHLLDESCFQLRRLNVPLDNQFYGKLGTYREILSKHPDFQDIKLPNHMRESKIDGEPDSHYFTKWRNYSFFSESAMEARKLAGTGVLGEYSPIKNVTGHGNDYLDALEWILARTKFTKQAREKLRNEIPLQRAKNGA